MSALPVPIIGFQPDLPQNTPGVIVTSSGIVPTERGIGSGLTAQAVGGNLPFGNSGAVVHTIGGAFRVFVGTSGQGVAVPAKLYELVNGTTLVDQSGSPYFPTPGWTFAQYGNTTLAVSDTNPLQASTYDLAPTPFAEVPNAPRAKIVITAGPPTRQFGLLFGYVTPADAFADGIFWSPDPATNWVPDTATQVGNIRLIDVNGGFTAAVPFRDGVIAFKEHAMYRGQYVGGGDMWTWTRISDAIGCVNQYAACQAEDVIYFVDNAALWVYDGSYPRRIPGMLHKWWSMNHTTSAVRVTWDIVARLLWIGHTLDFGALRHIVFNPLSQLWTQYGDVEGSPSFLMGHQHGTYRYAYSLISSTLLRLFFGRGNTAVAGSFTLGALGAPYDTVTIRGIRPEWLEGHQDPSNNTWCSAMVLRNQALRGVGTANAAGLAGGDWVNFDTAAPGRFDGEVEGRYLFPRISTANFFELARVHMDVTKGPEE